MISSIPVVSFQPSPFQPRFRNGHVQTLYAWARPRRFPELPQPEARYFDVAADARVLAHCHWHDNRVAHPTIILLQDRKSTRLNSRHT